MSHRNGAWVELAVGELRIIRIFKSEKAAVNSGRPIIKVNYQTAVEAIRYQLWLRSNGFCELCASVVTENSGHMHEQDWRGKGGEISLDNSVFICARTHKREHKDREPQWSKNS